MIRRNQMKSIDRDQLKRMNEVEHEDFVLINVLPRKVFSDKHIRTSINIPVESDDFVERVESVVGHKDRKVVVYCANFDCDASPKAAKKLEEAGFSKVHDYEGGTEDWFEQKQAA
jgi:rhodanese-related sulfurtransferase